jgi:hypothetical protein
MALHFNSFVIQKNAIMIDQIKTPNYGFTQGSKPFKVYHTKQKGLILTIVLFYPIF